jgi:hypothetical protein
MSRSFFLWIKSATGPKPVVQYEVLTHELQQKALAVVELSDDDKETVRSRLHEAMTKFGGEVSMLEILGDMFPCPTLE